MKGITTYYENGKTSFSIWQARLRDEMPQADGRGNPMLWWTKCFICDDYVVCGLDTKKESIEFTRAHMKENHQ